MAKPRGFALRHTLNKLAQCGGARVVGLSSGLHTCEGEEEAIYNGQPLNNDTRVLRFGAFWCVTNVMQHTHTLEDVSQSLLCLGEF